MTRRSQFQILPPLRRRPLAKLRPWTQLVAAEVARTLVLLTSGSAAHIITHPGSVASLVLGSSDAYVKRCLQVTGAAIEAMAAWCLPVNAARLSEGITEQVDLLKQRT